MSVASDDEIWRSSLRRGGEAMGGHIEREDDLLRSNENFDFTNQDANRDRESNPLNNNNGLNQRYVPFPVDVWERYERERQDILTGCREWNRSPIFNDGMETIIRHKKLRIQVIIKIWKI